ncbi:hypothetical protein FO519_000633 [Halicephalobus sp. NKZ332]|nr:hypothetical protein FO519_000633 [Halicephalobus sp. NKZ332]
MPAKYYVANGVKNLKLSTKIEYVGAAFGNLPSFTQFTQAPAQRRHSTIGEVTSGVRTQYESAVVSWQQKLIHPLKKISLPKVEVTSDPENPNAEDDESKKPEEDNRRSRIFTYINSELEAKKIVNNEPSSSTGLRQRKVGPMNSSALKDPITLLNERQRKVHRTVPFTQQSMHIVAYFGPLDKSSEEAEEADERVLCKIVATNKNTILFEPDIGTFRIETRYGLYSVTIAVHEEPKFDSIMDMETTIEEENKEIDEDATAFELPNPGKIWMQYLITIEEGLNFPHDGLYVEYVFQLPPHVRFAEGYEELASGRTQVCFTKEEDGSDVAKFSFPIEMVLEFSSKPKSGCSIKWPHLLCKVVSEDYWQRCFVNGYTQLSLPTTVGKHSLETFCWRPVNPNNHLAKMKDFFLGQAVDIHSIENQGIINSAIGNTVSNISILSESSGKLTFTVHCLRQSRQFISREVLRSLQYGTLLSKVGFSGSLHWRIMKVLMQFEEARLQLIRLRSQKLLK